MAEYRRPAPPSREFVDDTGKPIRYGERWGLDSPPSDSYSVTSNLERFAPLHDVAVALIGWLRAEYDVDVDEGPELATDLLRPPAEVERAVRLRPLESSASPLTFVFTPFPGVLLHAGALYDAFFPICGCDACDETWDRCADDLEFTVFAVVNGGLSEGWARRDAESWFRLRWEGRTSSGSSQASDLPPDRIAPARAAIGERREWAAWSQQTDGSSAPPESSAG
ncbi:DUF6226 family protein [Microbacterium ureisolvens]|uniref:DUF6226 family protein n=1 Tax=Microbacterium ureisolvens TaxID=2781186 RepID=UPI0036421E4D